jgi:DNA-binding FrmR family transcriptional regulator
MVFYLEKQGGSSRPFFLFLCFMAIIPPFRSYSSLLTYTLGGYMIPAEIGGDMKGNKTRHDENLNRLSRIDGQVRGVRRMVEEGEYCIDIVTQIQAAQSALAAVGKRILRKHMDHCVADALHGSSKKEAAKKIDEVMAILDRQMK